MSGYRLSWASSALLVALAALLSTPEPARACGGLFCSQAAPVNQAAERIIFSKNDDGTVTAVVQIQYEGPSEEFAWVLPVPGVPEVNVSSDMAFTRLQQASNPSFTFTTEVEGRCKRERGSRGSSSGAGAPAAFPSNEAGNDSGVEVLASGTVGPYDYVVIEPDISFEQVGDVVVEWLIEEGYDVVPQGGDPGDISDLLGGYMLEGMNLLAFRLTKGNDTGTIRPIRITYESERPMIPIRPTAIAANDDMGVMVWVLGESRAIPVNYKALELNLVLIDWLRGASNYEQVVVAAANEAGGQGFVAERAGPSSAYDSVVLLDFERDDWEAIRGSVSALTTQELVAESFRRFGGWDGYRALVERFLPPEVNVDELLGCPSCLGSAVANVDKQAFVDALGEEVVLPMIETQDLLLSRPYVTRLYTTLSAPEMDLDPLFDFNPDLSEVSNIHTARRIIECHRSVRFVDAPSRFVLEDGHVVRVSAGSGWPFSTADADAPPANALVMELSTSGPGVVVEDNSEQIDQALREHNATVPRPGCGCGVSTPRTHAAVWAGLAIFVLIWRRRSGRMA